MNRTRKFEQPRYNATKLIRGFDDHDKAFPLIDKYEKLDLLELITEFSIQKKMETPDKLTIDVLKAFILDELNICSTETLEFYDEWYMHEELVPSLKEMNEEINKLKNHRHKVAEGSYSEKPAW